MRTWAFGLYLLFIGSWFLHLSFRVPALGTLRADLVLATVIAALILAGRGDEQHPNVGRDKSTRRIVIAMGVYAIITLPFVEWPGSVLWFGIPAFAKALVFYFFTSELVDSERRLRYLLFVFVACQTFRVLEPVYLHLTQGYWGSFASISGWEQMDRLAGAPSDVVNPNGLAFVILTVLPFLHYFGPLTRTGAIAYTGVLPALIYALVLTGSRSGMLGLAITTLAIWLQSSRKWVLGLLVVAGVAFSISNLSENLTDRYRSIISSDTRNAATAQGRIAGTWQELSVAYRRPFFGHGLGTSLEANANFGGHAQPSHNLYVEVAQELGFVGLGLFLVFLLSLGRHLVRVLLDTRRIPHPRPMVNRLRQVLVVWLAMNLLFSLASYGLSSYEWYFLAGLCDVLVRLAGRPAQMAQPNGAPQSSNAY